MLFFLSEMSAECAVSLSEVSVDNVWPLYGPLAGGTRVTISGRYLTTSSVHGIYLGRLSLCLCETSNRCLVLSMDFLIINVYTL